MPPHATTDLSAIAQAAQWFGAYSLMHLLPEAILAVGFLLALLIDLFVKGARGKTVVAYFAIVVLAVAGVMAIGEWQPYRGGEWPGGTLLFPYTQTLPIPAVIKGKVWTDYGMLVVDNFAVFFKLLVSLAGIVVLLMSLASRELAVRRRHFGEFAALILGVTVGLYLMPAATDLLMMYLSLELVSIGSYILVGYSKSRPRSAEASLKYVLFGALSSGLMLYGFSLFYGMTGTTNVIAIRQVLAVQSAQGLAQNHVMLWLATVLALAGMGYKIAAVPFHFWAPDVYEGAPTSVTAFLSVATKAAGFGLLMRFVLFVFPADRTSGLPIIDWPMTLAILAAVTMTFGNLAALLQSNVKRMLAYSSIAHAGYILVGLVVAGSEVGVLGHGRSLGDSGIVSVMIYLATYLFMNLGAFYVVMLIENKLASEELDDYRALVDRSPLLASGLTIFLVSLTGIPLTAGFIGKFYVFTAALQRDPRSGTMPWLWLAVLAIANSLVALYYYLRVVGAMFLKRPLREIALKGSDAALAQPSEPIRYAMPAKVLLFALIIPVLLLGVYFQPLVDLASGVIRFFDFQQL